MNTYHALPLWLCTAFPPRCHLRPASRCRRSDPHHNHIVATQTQSHKCGFCMPVSKPVPTSQAAVVAPRLRPPLRRRNLLSADAGLRRLNLSSISAQSQRRLSTAPLPADAPPRSANATSGHRRRGIAARPAAPRRVHNRRAVPRNNRVHCADRAVCRRNRTSAKARADAFWVGCRSPPRTHMGICRQHEPPWAEGTHTRVPCHLASSGDTKQIDPAQAIKPRFGSP